MAKLAPIKLKTVPLIPLKTAKPGRPKSNPVELDEGEIDEPAPVTVKAKGKRAKVVDDDDAINEPTSDVMENGLTPLQSKMLGIYAKTSDSIQKELMVSSDAVDDIGFYINSLTASVLLGKITSSFYVISGKEMSSKCQTGETMVSTSKGILHLDELIDKKGVVENKEGITVATHKGPQKISHTYMGQSEILRVTTKNNRTVRGTPNHPMMVVTPELDYVWKNLEELQVGDWLVSPRYLECVYGNNTSVSLSMATIMGYLTANGQGSRLSSLDPVVISNFYKCVMQETGKVAYSYDNGRVHSVPGKGLGAFGRKLEALGYSGDAAYTKHIPLSVRQAPKEVIHEFLQSYFECDSGIVKKNRVIQLISASEELINQLHSMLQMMYGIRGKKKAYTAFATNSKTPKKQWYYRLDISGHDAVQFVAEFPRAKASAKFDKTSGIKAQGLLKRVPYVKGLTEKAYAKAKVGTDSRDMRVKSTGGDILRNFRKPEYTLISTAGRNGSDHATEYLFYRENWVSFIPHLAKIDPDLSKKIEAMLKMDFDYDVITSIEPDGYETVYDITVPTTECFIANGFVSHNSTMVAMMMGASLKNGTLINKHADAENAMRSGHLTGIIEQSCGIPWKVLQGKRDEKGRLIEHARYKYHTNPKLENIFDDMIGFMESLPDKIYDAKTKKWYLVYENASISDEHKINMAAMKEILPVDKKSGKNFTYFCMEDDDSLQAVLVIDSIKAMNLTKKESGLRYSEKPAEHAAALAKVLPQIKGNLRNKHVAFFCTNQVMENPLAMMNRKPAEYETSGNALKTNSDVRCIASSVGVQDPFEKDKDDYSMSSEPSVLRDGKDYYMYKKMKNIKNKNSTPNYSAYLRVWVRGAKQTPGYDPVYDAAYYYKMLGLLKMGTKAKQPILYFDDDDIFNDDEGNRIASMTWMDFKYMILSEYYNSPNMNKTPREPQLEQYLIKNNICQLELIKVGFQLLESKEAYERINGRIAANEIEIDHTDEDDED